MSTGENIRNALQVLYKTYDNVNKMMEQCKTVASDRGYEQMTDKFLRWKSDQNPEGWLTNSFIHLYQKNADPECISKNGWHNGPVYTLEICLGRKADADQLPQVVLSKFEYEDIVSWSAGCSINNNWAFQQPVHEPGKRFDLQQTEDVFVSKPLEEKTIKSYWGLRQVTFVKMPLTDIISANLEEKIFGTFDRLSNLS